MTNPVEEYKQELNHRLADLERSRSVFQSCLTVAMEICKLMLEDMRDNGEFDEEGTVIGGGINLNEQIVPLLERELNTTVDEEQVNMMGQMVAMGLMRHGLKSCAMWYIAHNLEHIFYGEEGPTQH